MVYKVKDLKCKFCTIYESIIATMPNFSNIFILGSKNYKKSAVEDHATNNKHHLKAYGLYLKSKAVPIAQRAKVLSSVSSCSDVVSGIATMDKKDMERTKRKFEVS